MTDIGQACKTRSGYVAFIYADGDSIGRYMSSRETPAAYKQASSGLKEATKKAVYQSLAHFLRPALIKRASDDRSKEEKEVNIHPFEVIAIGGDDALLIVPGDMGLPIALDISQRFTELLPQGLTMSVGVVIASDHTPVRSLRDIAKQLCRSAKTRVRHTHKTNTPEGGLDFLVLTSQSLLRRDLHDLRTTYPIQLPGEGQGTRLRLTNAPYTISEANILWDLLLAMRQTNFPTSQLQQLAAALREGRERGSLYFLYQQARLHRRPYGNIFAAIEDIIKNQAGFDPARDPIPWQEIKSDGNDIEIDVRYTSLLPDLADLYSFVPAKGDSLKRGDSIVQEVVDAR